VRTRKLELACPVCGSAEVFYSCTPNCCYNHVCSACGATFEPATARKGGVVRGVLPPDPPPDATDPTAECVACGSTAVYLAEDGGVVCGKCGAALDLEYTEVSPA
jgi:transcription elongation factor Elf1